jgi:hypothetical protein
MESKALLEWNSHSFHLSYKYDIAFMADDVVKLVLLLQQNESGTWEVDWPSSGFPYRWDVRWDAHEVKIQAQARPEPGAEEISGNGFVRVGREVLIQDLQRLLAAVLSCLRMSGYSAEQITGLDGLSAAVLETG